MATQTHVGRLMSGHGFLRGYCRLCVPTGERQVCGTARADDTLHDQMRAHYRTTHSVEVDICLGTITLANQPASAAKTLGARGGKARARRMSASDQSAAGRQAVLARWIERPVLAVRHDAEGQPMEGWPCVGSARSWTEAIRLVRAAGYRVPSRRTPGWSWETVPREVAETDVDAFGVIALPRA